MDKSKSALKCNRPDCNKPILFVGTGLRIKVTALAIQDNELMLAVDTFFCSRQCYRLHVLEEIKQEAMNAGNADAEEVEPERAQRNDTGY